MILSHCFQDRSCFDKLSMNGFSGDFRTFSVRPEPVEGRYDGTELSRRRIASNKTAYYHPERNEGSRLCLKL
jgi:hypothetical protein